MSKKNSVSTLLSVTELNDYILPSQACVIPPTDSNKIPHSNIKILENRKGFQQSPPKKQEPISISLKDCLACSGCITSTELAFVTQQSISELMKSIETKFIIASVSPQSIASIAAKYSTTWHEMASRVCFFLKFFLNVKKIYDQRSSTILALSLTLSEFLKSDFKQPIISSECPAVISYIEKSHSSFVPFLSKVKTSQQILGDILKRQFTNKEIFHFSIVPCFDKKLETFRDQSNIDHVITTSELESLCSEKFFNLDQCIDHGSHLASFDTFTFSIPTHSGNANLDSFPFHSTASSYLDPFLNNMQMQEHFNDEWGTGGYLSCILTYLSNSKTIEKKVGRSSDFIEWHISDKNSTSGDSLVLATCYGFKNIQNVLRKMKSPSVNYAYIEMMACPSACINGGGQVTTDNLKEFLKTASSIYQQSLPLDLFSSIYPWKIESEDLPFKASFKAVELVELRPSWAQVQW